MYEEPSVVYSTEGCIDMSEMHMNGNSYLKKCVYVYIFYHLHRYHGHYLTSTFHTVIG